MWRRGVYNYKNKKNKCKLEKGDKYKPKADAWKLICPKKVKAWKKTVDTK